MSLLCAGQDADLLQAGARPAHGQRDGAHPSQGQNVLSRHAGADALHSIKMKALDFSGGCTSVPAPSGVLSYC